MSNRIKEEGGANDIDLKEYPSLAAFVRIMRMTLGLSVRAASREAGWPEGSWGSLESGRTLHPSRQKIWAASAVLEIRPWILHYITKTDDMLDRIVNLSKPRSSWGKEAGAFVREARTAHERSVGAAVQTWSQQWPVLSLTEEDWLTMEASGALPSFLPPPLRGVAPSGANLAVTKGPWAWAILWAATGSPRLAAFLLPGFTVAAGQLELAKDTRQYEEVETFSLLEEKWQASYQSGDFNASTFFREAMGIASRLGAFAVSDAALVAQKKLGEVEEYWNHLTPAQHDQILHLLRSMIQGGNEHPAKE